MKNLAVLKETDKENNNMKSSNKSAQRKKVSLLKKPKNNYSYLTGPEYF
jgi:hypothetical protein